MSQPHSPKFSEIPISPRMQGGQGGCRITAYACDVFPCCWNVSKDISGADETFQHIHLESAVSLPSCIIYHPIPSCLKDCFKLFSESSFPPFAASCNNLSKIYFGSGILQQRLVLFAFFPTVLLQMQKVGWFLGSCWQGRGSQILCPEALPCSPLEWGCGGSE